MRAYNPGINAAYLACMKRGGEGGGELLQSGGLYTYTRNGDTRNHECQPMAHRLLSHFDWVKTFVETPGRNLILNLNSRAQPKCGQHQWSARAGGRATFTVSIPIGKCGSPSPGRLCRIYETGIPRKHMTAPPSKRSVYPQQNFIPNDPGYARCNFGWKRQKGYRFTLHVPSGWISISMLVILCASRLLRFEVDDEIRDISAYRQEHDIRVLLIFTQNIAPVFNPKLPTAV